MSLLKKRTSYATPTLQLTFRRATPPLSLTVVAVARSCKLLGADSLNTQNKRSQLCAIKKMQKRVAIRIATFKEMKYGTVRVEVPLGEGRVLRVLAGDMEQTGSHIGSKRDTTF